MTGRQKKGGSGFALRKQAGVLLLAAALAFPLVLFAQNPPHPNPVKQRGLVMAPDFSGVWFIDEYRRNLLPKEDPPFQPWALEKFNALQEEKVHQDPDDGPDPTERCIPPGIPREMEQPFPFEIVQTRDRVIMIFEYQSLIRQIFTDGRSHPQDLEPTYMGNAIGHYEGNTLVIDTVGFNDKTWLDPMGLPHSDQLHVIEHLRRVDHDTLVDDYTIDDPKAYTRPWTAQKVFKLKPDWQIKEYVCTENNNVK